MNNIDYRIDRTLATGYPEPETEDDPYSNWEEYDPSERLFESGEIK